MAKKVERQSVPSPPPGGTDPNAALSSNVSSSGNVPARGNAPLAMDTATSRQAPKHGTERVVGVVKITFQGIEPTSNSVGAEFHVSVFLWPLIWAVIAAYGTDPPMFPMEEDMLLQGMFPATGFQIQGPQRDNIITALETALQEPEFMERPSKSYENLDIGAAYPQLRDLPKPAFNSGDFLKKCNEFLNFLKNNKGYIAEVVTSQVTLSPQKPGGGATSINDDIKVCLQCGRPNKKTSKFCLVCGKKFEELEADAGMLARALAPDAKAMEDWTKKARHLVSTDREAALEYYEKLMPYKGNDVSFWNEVGKVLQEMGREDAASEAFQKAASTAKPSAKPAVPEPPQRYCSQCGKENRAAARFCVSCGHKFT